MSDPTGQAHNAGPTFAGALVSQVGITICYARCVACQFGQCPGGDHRWAGFEDIEHAESIGKPETAEGRCSCPCALGTELAAEPDDGWEVSLNGEPCPTCGETGACAYDNEGRALIHATDEPDEESHDA